VGVPSAAGPDPAAAVPMTDNGRRSPGVWRKPWDEVIQSEWLEAFFRIAVAKPFVTAVSWRDFSDHQPHQFPHGGLLRKDLHPKIAYQRLEGLRHEIWPQSARRTEDSNVIWPEA
jgi:hypothetical protein